jgi:hypothetical protein
MSSEYRAEIDRTREEVEELTQIAVEQKARVLKARFRLAKIKGVPKKHAEAIEQCLRDRERCWVFFESSIRDHGKLLRLVEEFGIVYAVPACEACKRLFTAITDLWWDLELYLVELIERR